MRLEQDAARWKFCLAFLHLHRTSGTADLPLQNIASCWRYGAKRHRSAAFNSRNHVLFQPHFLAPRRRGVDGVEDVLELQRLVERHQGLLAIEDRRDEVMNAVLAVWELGNVEVDGLVAVGAIAKHAGRIEADAGVLAEKVD